MAVLDYVESISDHRQKTVDTKGLILKCSSSNEIITQNVEFFMMCLINILVVPL